MSNNHVFFSANDARRAQRPKNLQRVCRPILIKITEAIRRHIEDDNEETELAICHNLGGWQSLIDLKDYEMDEVINSLEKLGYNVECTSHNRYHGLLVMYVSWKI